MNTVTKLLLRFLIVVLVFPLQAFSQNDQSLAFYIWAENLAPIISKDTKSGDFSGIVVDIFDSMSDYHSGAIDYEVHNRVRGEQQLYTGKFQATILSPQWVAEPKKLLFSESIYEHVEHLYALKPIANEPIRTLIKDRTICTRRGYRYPRLDILFDQNYAKRMDSNTEEAMLRMLLLQRCDFVLSNEFVAEWLIDKFAWKNTIYKSPVVVDSVGFKLAFHPDKSELLDRVNQHIVQLKKTGQLEKIISFHRDVAAQQSQIGYSSEHIALEMETGTSIAGN